MDTRQQHIVVGIGRSAAGRAALAWAAREAALRGATLHVVRAWDPARHAAPYAPAGAMPTGEKGRARAGEELAAVVREVFGAMLPAGVTTEVAEGVAERVLVDCSAQADLLVLGATSSPLGHADEEWPAGPVVRACLAHARCPVVIVGTGDTGPRSPDLRTLASGALVG